jgi:Tetratricopeptide repeat
VDLPRDYVWLASASMLAEACALLGDQQRAASLYQQLAPFATRTVTSGAAMVWMGPVAHSLGLLAMAMGRWDQAVVHLEDSLATSTREGARVSAARSGIAYARVLLQRARAGDSVKAQDLLDKACVTAEDLGLAGITAMCRRLQKNAHGTDA